MESIRMTLNQVNFEEGDLEPSQELSSFSNLVAYDSPLEHDSGLPIISRVFQPSKGDAESDWLRAKSSLAELEQLNKQDEKPSDEAKPATEEGDEDEDEMGDRSLAFEPSLDSFKAFTDTVEALALQRSVIGGTSITPASPEEVAKVIAATQNKLTSTPIGPASTTALDDSNSAILMTKYGAAVNGGLALEHSVKDGHEDLQHDLQDGVPSDLDESSLTASNSAHATEHTAATASVNISKQSGSVGRERSMTPSEQSGNESVTDLSTSSLHVFAGGSSTVNTTFSTMSSQADVRSLGSDVNLSGSEVNLEGSPPKPEVKKPLKRHGSHESNASLQSADQDSSAQEATPHHRYRQDAPRQQLVPVPSNQITTITERSGRSVMAGPIPSERIKPAELPPHAQSLVLPIVDDSPKRQMQVEEWLGLRPASHRSRISSLASSQTSSSDVDPSARHAVGSESPPSDKFTVHSSAKRKPTKISKRQKQLTDKKSDSGSPQPTITTDNSAAAKTDSPALEVKTHTQAAETMPHATPAEPTSPAVENDLEQSQADCIAQKSVIDTKQTVTHNTLHSSTSVHVMQEKTQVVVTEQQQEKSDAAPTSKQPDVFDQRLTEGFRSSKQAQQYRRDDNIYRVSSETNLATSVEIKQQVSSEVSVHTTVVQMEAQHKPPGELAEPAPQVNAGHETVNGIPVLEQEKVQSPVLPEQSAVSETVDGTPLSEQEKVESSVLPEQGASTETKSSAANTITESRVVDMQVRMSKTVLIQEEIVQHSEDIDKNKSLISASETSMNVEPVMQITESDAVKEAVIESMQLSTSAVEIPSEPLQTSTPVKTETVSMKTKKGKGNKRKTKEIHEKFRQKAQTLEIMSVNKAESENEKEAISTKEKHEDKEAVGMVTDMSRASNAVNKSNVPMPSEGQNAVCDTGTVTYNSTLSHSDTRMLGDSVLLGNNIDYLSSELERVLKEKVKLEGQLEMLEKDARTAMRDRAQLQAQLSAMSQQVRQQQSSAQGLRGDQSAMTADLETLRQHRTRLEAVVVDAQRLLEEKDGEVKVMEDELTQMKETNERLHETIQHTKQVTQTKENTIQALKSKVAELYVEYQTTHQARLLAEGEIKSLQSEVKSVVNAREWYQEQLQATQVAKHDLQQELSVAQTERIAQNTLIDRLKADNVRVKQQLAEAHHRMIQEKELLARHLETIEADMLEREAAFQQLQSQREQVEEMLNNQDDAAREAEVAQTIADLQEEIRKYKNDIRRKDATVHVMEHEQADLVKRLTFSQESLLERDKTIEGLEQKYVDAEVEVQKTKQEVHKKEEEMARLRDLKSAIEIELSLAREEKHTFDETLLGIKKDMAQVGNNFKQIKQEMQEKRQEIEKLNVEKRDLREQIEALQREIADEKNRVEEKELASPVIKQESTVLVHSSALYQDKSRQTPPLDNQQLEMMQQQQTRLETELSVAQRRIADMEGQIQVLQTEKLHLEGQVAAREVDQTSWKEMEAENNALKAQISELHRQSHQEISKHKATVVKLGKDLENVQLELTQRQTAYEQSLEEAGKQMMAVQKAKSELDAHLESQMMQHDLTSGGPQENSTLIVESAQKQGPKSAEEVNRKLKAELTAEEVNRKLQDEMRRAVDHIESQFKAKEAVMQADFAERLKQFSAADNTEKNLRTQIEEAQKSLEETKVHLNQIVEELESVKQAKLTLEDEVKELSVALDKEIKQSAEQSRKADVVEETNKILKAEMQAVMMRFAESEPEKAELFQRFTKEHEARVELEAQLEATNLRITQEIEGKISELQHELSEIKEQKVALEAQLQGVVPQEMLSVYEAKLDDLMQNLGKDTPSNISVGTDQSSDAPHLLDFFFMKLSAVIKQLHEIRDERNKAAEDQERLVAENSHLKEAVLVLSKEKDEVTKQYEEKPQQSAINQPVLKPASPLEEQVTVFMNRADSDYNRDSTSDSTQRNLNSASNASDVEKSIVHYEHRFTEIIQRLEISQEIKQSLTYELRVILQDVRDAGMSSGQHSSRLSSSDRDETDKSSTDSQLVELQALQAEHQEVVQQNEALENLLQEVQSALRSRSDQLQQLQAEHHTSVSFLQHELTSAQTEIQRFQAQEMQRVHSEDEMRKMTLELEREKGRLVGILQSHDALRDHATTLEKANAELELKAADMSAHHQEELQTRDKHTEELMSKVEELQSSLSKEKLNVKEIKKQLLTEKGKHVKLRRQVESNWMDSDQMNVDLELKNNDVVSLANELEKVRQAELAARLEAERHRGDSHGAKLEVDRLRRELKEKKAKEPVLQESIQTLEWHVQQLTAQLKSAQEQLASAEERHQMEMKSVQATVQGNSNELSALRAELNRIKQERTQLQTRIAELKAALESGLTQAKLMKSQRRVNKEILEKEIKTKMPPMPFDMSHLESLLAQATPAAPTSKSLSFLQETLSSLRGEISTLQVQVDDHIGAVQNSSTAWKELEAQVKDLRDVCKTSAAGRSANSPAASTS